jgi:hypothetical protein
MKYRIRKGATVSQDFTRIEWQNESILFFASDHTISGKRKCIADGYGSFLEGEKYGNGALYVDENDLILEEANKCMEYDEYFKKMVLPYVKDNNELKKAAYVWGEAAWNRCILENRIKAEESK